MKLVFFSRSVRPDDFRVSRLAVDDLHGSLLVNAEVKINCNANLNGRLPRCRPDDLRGSRPDDLRGSRPDDLRGCRPDDLRGSRPDDLRGSRLSQCLMNFHFL
ncbi:hypothetical protein F2Q69_00021288 [Brassica cretica]|uniref:Uncharacterized protein n=1 Tax=Brassica cretica TaxID=69181 RepID=A0A8S9QS03_BRACR|nr:hypothetical protein F2Q69_00021288 [Brassica cretica]